MVFVACKKESGTSALQIKMTDAPADYQEVNVDLKEVKVNFNDDSTGWVSLQTKDTIYNLLGLQNGLDTLIAQGTVPSSTIKEIRLILGDNNTIKVNGQIYPLTIPSGSESGLKIKVNKKLKATLETLIIDFDAAMSVNNEADGYKLRPVIRVK
jgi:DNA polymerase III sliding clamp (beta) subunit (PCNA family)